MYPDDVKYTPEHEWARIDGQRATVGITDYAQDALGDIVYVDLPPVGTTVVGGETFGEVESTKSVSDLYSPVSGTIVEPNAEPRHRRAGCSAPSAVTGTPRVPTSARTVGARWGPPLLMTPPRSASPR